MYKKIKKCITKNLHTFFTKNSKQLQGYSKLLLERLRKLHVMWYVSKLIITFKHAIHTKEQWNTTDMINFVQEIVDLVLIRKLIRELLVIWFSRINKERTLFAAILIISQLTSSDNNLVTNMLQQKLTKYFIRCCWIKKSKMKNHLNLNLVMSDCYYYQNIG